MQIFISYSSIDKEKVDIIDKDFQSIGINLIRDTRDLKPKGSIKEFMKRVRSTDYVVMVISDSFIKSYYCMYEVLELLEESRFQERLLPILLPNLKIFNTNGAIGYIKYWENILEKENDSAKGIKELSNIEGVVADINHYRKIRNNIDQFIGIIRDMKSWKFNSLRNEAYKSMIIYLGIKEVDTYADILEIQTIADPEEQEIELYDFLTKNPNHKLALFHRAFLAAEEGKYLVAKDFYNRVLKIDNSYESAHFNLGLCLVKLNENETAKKHFIKTLEINPSNAVAFLQLGIIHMKDLDIEEAKSCFLKTIELDEGNSEAYNNLGILYRDKIKEINIGIEYFLAAYKLKPKELTIILNLAFSYELINDENMAYFYYSQAYGVQPHNIELIRKMQYFQNKNDVYAKTLNEPTIASKENDIKKLEEKIEPDYLEIRTPIVGYYRSAREYEGITYQGGSYYHDGYPNYDNAKIIKGTEYIKVGDYIKSGQVIGQVFVMSWFEDIESEVGGYIVDKVAKGGPVEYDEVLYLVDPNKPETLIINSPIVGDFHRSGIIIKPGLYDYSEPKECGRQDGVPYIEKGDYIEKGQVICVFQVGLIGHEIQSEVEGYIYKVLVEDRSAVEFEQPLFEIIPKRKK